MSGLEEISFEPMNIEKLNDDTTPFKTPSESVNDIKESTPQHKIAPVVMQDLDLLMDPQKSRPSSPNQSSQPQPVSEPVKVFKDPEEKMVETKPSFKIKPVKKESTDTEKVTLESLDLNIDTITVPPVVEKMSVSHKTDFDSTSHNTSYGTQNYSEPMNNSVSRESKENGIEKQELLFKLKRFELRGIPLSRKFSQNSSIEDMRDEFLRIKAQRDLENSVRFQRKTMMAFVSGAEFLNSKFDPFDVKLDGWSESIHENINDYDEVFEELHDKYKTKAKVAPEVKLLMMLGGSAIMFHMTNALFKNSMPGVEDILKQNPDLMRQFQTAAMNSAMGGEGVEEQPQYESGGEFGPRLSNIMEDMINSVGPSPQQNANRGFEDVSEMKGPSDQDVDRILNQIQNIKKDTTKDIEYSETTSIADSQVGKRKRGRPKKEANVPSLELNL